MVPFQRCHLDFRNFPFSKAAKARMARQRLPPEQATSPALLRGSVPAPVPCLQLLTSLAPHKSSKWVTLTAPISQMRN